MNTEREKYLLKINNLKVHFHTLEGTVRAVEDASLTIEPGMTMGLVGESGCGKSVTAHSILRLLPTRTCQIKSGEILFRRQGNNEVIDLAKVDPDGELIRSIRGHEIAMVFQEPMTSLSPVFTVGNQIIEAIMLHRRLQPQEAREYAAEMLKAVALPEDVIDEYPYRLSGGQRQRAMTAMALSCHPSLLIADEPTTALDVTTQAQIIELLKSLQQQLHMAILMITHNLGVIAETADRVAVMYLGRVVESGTVKQIFDNPLHPYTIGLLKSIPRMGSETKKRLAPIPGSVPDPLTVIEGCAFRLRCPVCKQKGCDGKDVLDAVETEPEHFVHCLLYS
jgi:peptide/nickel transport system ATP-binding protein